MTTDDRSGITPEERADFQKALNAYRQEMDDARQRLNSVSPAFEEEFAVLAAAVRNTLEVPDASERQLPASKSWPGRGEPWISSSTAQNGWFGRPCSTTRLQITRAAAASGGPSPTSPRRWGARASGARCNGRGHRQLG